MVNGILKLRYDKNNQYQRFTPKHNSRLNRLSPIGVVSALGVFGARVAGVIARLFAERRETRRGVPLRDGRGGLDFIIRR